MSFTQATPMPSARGGLLGDGFSNGFEDRRLGRETSAAFLGDLHPVNPYGEFAAATRFEIGVKTELVLDERRHTGSAGFVISNHAEPDLDPCHGSNCSRRFQGFQGVCSNVPRFQVPTVGTIGHEPVEPTLEPWNPGTGTIEMPSLIEAIEIKRKSYFEFENAPYHCLDVEVSKPTARGGQTLVRLKMRNLITRAVFDKTFKAGEKFGEPDLVMSAATFSYSDADGFHFMDQETFETLTLGADILGEDRGLLVDNVEVQIHRYNGQPIGIVFPPHVELTVTKTEMGVRGNTASGSVTKSAVLETGLEIQVPLFIKEGEKVKVHTETREFAAAAAIDSAAIAATKAAASTQS